MELIYAWIICLLGVSLLGNVQAQGSCTICNKTTVPERCTHTYYPPVKIDGDMCIAIAQNKDFETNVCRDYPHGYQIKCEQAITGNEYDCLKDCPPPPVIERQYGNTGVFVSPGHIGAIGIWGFFVTILTRFLQ